MRLSDVVTTMRDELPAFRGRVSKFRSSDLSISTPNLAKDLQPARHSFDDRQTKFQSYVDLRQRNNSEGDSSSSFLRGDNTRTSIRPRYRKKSQAPPVPRLVEPTSSSDEEAQCKPANTKENLHVSSSSTNSKSAPTTPQNNQLSPTPDPPPPPPPADNKTSTHGFNHSDRHAIKQLSTSTPVMTQAHSLSGGPTDPPGSVGAPSSPASSNQYLQTLSSSKARQKKFHRHFKQVAVDERVLDYYSCALVADILLQGHLYITRNYFAFYSNVFGYVTKLLIPTVDVIKVSKEKTVRIIPNAVGVTTGEEKHVFGSLLSRDTTYNLMHLVWKAATNPVNEIEVHKTLKDELDDSASGEILLDEDSSVSGSGNEGRRTTKIVVQTQPAFSKIIPKINNSGITLSVAAAAAATSTSNTATTTATTTSTTTIHYHRKSWSLPGTSTMLTISTCLLIVLFLSAGLLIYRIQKIQNHFSELPIISNSEDIYEELVKWQANLHTRSANEVNDFLNTNLNQLAKVRISLETLSMLILTSSNKLHKNTAGGDNTRTADSNQIHSSKTNS